MNLYTDWASAISSHKGAITGLGRILLQRQELSFIPNDHDSNGSMGRLSVNGNDDEAEQANGSAELKSTTPEELLCLVLAILTSSVLSDMTTAQAIVSTSSSQPLQPHITADMPTSAIDEGCIGLRSCLRSCQCFDASPLPIHLIQLYLRVSAGADEVSYSTLRSELFRLTRHPFVFVRRPWECYEDTSRCLSPSSSPALPRHIFTFFLISQAMSATKSSKVSACHWASSVVCNLW